MCACRCCLAPNRPAEGQDELKLWGSAKTAKFATGGAAAQPPKPSLLQRLVLDLRCTAAASQLRLSVNAASLDGAVKPPVVTMLQGTHSSSGLGASIMRAASGFWQGFSTSLAPAAVQTSQLTMLMLQQSCHSGCVSITPMALLQAMTKVCSVGYPIAKWLFRAGILAGW